jgi:formylglycine-generating enzyme required for sulfatase activity
MAGGVAEWVKDRNGKPVLKGGSWATSPERLPDLKISHRVGKGPRESSYDIGFRLVVQP